MKFKKGDRFKVTRLLGLKKGESCIETIIEVNSFQYEIISSNKGGTYYVFDAYFTTSLWYNVKKINHYNTKLGRILYKT